MKRKKTQNLGLKQRLKNSSPAEREDLISGLPYSIGYAKPPASGQFKPGQSGNRRGRSKGCGDLGKLLEDELNVTVEVAEGGRRLKLSKAQISVRQLANKSAGGDLRAFLAAVDVLRKTGRLREDSTEPEAVFTQEDLQAAAEILQFFTKKRGETMTVNPSDLLEAYRTSFSLFAIKVFNIINPGQRFIPTGAFLAMAHALSELHAGRIKRLLITVPPRSGKSILASVALPAFVLGRDPTKRVLCASYSGELSAKFARDCRSVMMHPSYRQLFPATVIAGKNTEAEIETAHGGFRYATSVGGTLTGRGGNYIVVDDPIKPEDAMSRAARDRSWDWFTGTVGSRLDNKAEDAIIVVMQRLHVDDLAGHLLEQGESADTSTFTMAGVHIRALTAAHRIKPTSPRCRSVRQPNSGRRSTYRRGDSVQTTGTSSDLLSAKLEEPH